MKAPFVHLMMLERAGMSAGSVRCPNQPSSRQHKYFSRIRIEDFILRAHSSPAKAPTRNNKMPNPVVDHATSGCTGDSRVVGKRVYIDAN